MIENKWEKFMKETPFRVGHQLGSQLPTQEVPIEHYSLFLDGSSDRMKSIPCDSYTN
jgi:hypothetical protein